MRAKFLIAAVCLAFAAPSLANAGNAKSVSPYAKYSMEELRQGDMCRDEVTSLWRTIGPMSGSLLKRDFMLDSNKGTMHTADVQHMRRHIRDEFNKTKYRMLGAMDIKKCRRLADNLIDYVTDYINQHAY